MKFNDSKEGGFFSDFELIDLARQVDEDPLVSLTESDAVFIAEILDLDFMDSPNGGLSESQRDRIASLQKRYEHG